MPDPKSPSLLDADAVSRGEALGLLARTVVEGYRVGEHRSPFKGFAIEFAQHREYTTGDDLRHLDWKVLGRTDRHYIKQYEQDTNFVAHLLLDGSESMNYGSAAVSKLHYAKALAACLAHLVLVQRDAVALNLFDTEVRERLSRTDNPGRIHHIMDRLAAFRATQKTALAVALSDLARQLKARGIVILISDLMAEDDEALANGLRQLRFGGSEVIVFHVLDPHEIDFPFTGTVEFEGLEGGPLIETQPASIRKSYLEAFATWHRSVRSACDRAGCHYVLANSAHSLAETLSGYLAFRRKTTAR